MRLIQQILSKKISLSEENTINRRYARSVWQFYNAYNLALALTKTKDNNIKRKNRILKRFLLSTIEKSDENSKIFKKVQELMRDDLKVIIKALSVIQKNKEENYEFGEYYKIGSVGCLSWEFPEQN